MRGGGHRRAEDMLESIQIPCRGEVLQLSPAGASLLDFGKRDGIKRCGLQSVQVSLFPLLD